MGMSKKDMGRKNANLKREIQQLEVIVKNDPLKKNAKAHDRLAELKKKVGNK